MDDQLTDGEYEVDEGHEVFTVKSVRENLAINLGLVVLFAIALWLSMLLLPRMLVGLSWDGA